MAYPLEARLRPAHELGAASVSALGAALVLSSPGLFLVSPPWHLALAGLLLGHAAWRGAAGLSTLRYRANLRRRRRYELGSADIPWSADAALSGARVSVGPASHPTLVRGAAPGEPAAAPGRTVSQVRRRRSCPLRMNSVASAGIPPSTVSSPTRADIWMDLERSSRAHAGAGHHARRQDAAGRAADRPGHPPRRGGDRVRPEGRHRSAAPRLRGSRSGRGAEGSSSCSTWDIRSISARYNPVGSFSRITEVATRIAGQLPSEGQSAAFKEFVWRFVNVMARALVALGRKPDYEQINRYASERRAAADRLLRALARPGARRRGLARGAANRWPSTRRISTRVCSRAARVR